VKKHAWTIAAALVLSFGAAGVHAATDFEIEEKTLNKAARAVPCKCTINDRMGILVAAPAFGSVDVYVPACRVRQFINGTGAFDVENFCMDFEILH